MSRPLFASTLSAIVFTTALLAPAPAHAVPFILSDAEAGHECNSAVATAVVYYHAMGNTYLYTCNGNHWIYSGML